MSGHRIPQDIFSAKAALQNIIPDPGDGKVIPVGIDDGLCKMSLGAGAETRVLNASGSTAEGVPDGVRVGLQLDVDGGGSLTIVFGTAFDGSNSTMVFADVNDYCELIAMRGLWLLTVNRGVALS